MSKIAKFWPVILLIVITFILRVIKLEELFYFTYDESIPAFVGRRLILWKHIPLIGGVTPFNFHLGPYFYWFYSAILFLGKLNPIAWGYASAIIAMATTFMIFVVGKVFSSKKIALTAAIFWAFSYLANVYDRHLWALYWGPLVSLIVVFCLYKIIHSHAVILSPSMSLRASRRISGYTPRSNLRTKNLNDKYIYFLGLTIALSIHADPSNLVFLVLAILAWIIYKLPIKKSTFFALGLITFSFLPLILFDLRHNFANTKPVVGFWKQGRNDPGFEMQKFINNSSLFPRAFTRLIYTFDDNQIAKQYSYCQAFVKEKYQVIPPILVFLSSISIIGFVVWALGKNQENVGWRLIAILVILYLVGIQLYGTIFRADIFEHYITGLFALFLLIFANIVSLLPKKLWLLVLGLFIVFNLNKLLNAKNSMGLTYKRQAIEFTMQQVGDKPFSLDSLSTCWRYSGYRYLFAVFGQEPVKSYVDPNFASLYGTTPVAQKHPPTVVSFVIHDFTPETEDFYKRYAVLKYHEVKNAPFGNIEVVVMNNSTGWFDQ